MWLFFVQTGMTMLGAEGSTLNDSYLDLAHQENGECGVVGKKTL